MFGAERSESGAGFPRVVSVFFRDFSEIFNRRTTKHARSLVRSPALSFFGISFVNWVVFERSQENREHFLSKVVIGSCPRW